MQAAQLQVVQHGSRASFRRRVIDAMRSVVSAPAAFFCLGTDDHRAYAEGMRLVDGAASVVRASSGVRLSQAFGFAVADVAATNRRAYRAAELYPDADRAALPYWKEHAKNDRLTDALLVFFHEGGVLFGLGVLERRVDGRSATQPGQHLDAKSLAQPGQPVEADGPFTDAEVERLETLAPFVVAGARSQIAYDELTREAAALRALGRAGGTLFVVDRTAKKVLWAVDRVHGVDWQADVLPIEDALVGAVEIALEARARGDALPTPPRLPSGSVTGVAKIDDEPVFGTARCAVVRVEPLDPKAGASMEGLSRREREIARLLVAGYSGVNVAAIAGLSENTVRTYVRRLYQKLSVSNRADLVRKLVAPEPSVGSSPPSSQIAPPDSALAQGDDTLD